jgi:hypothetical protein
MKKPIDAETWDRDWDEWRALKDACQATHKTGGLQGQGFCICGAACGGSVACGGLRNIINFIRTADTKRMRAADRQWIEHMRDFI